MSRSGTASNEATSEEEFSAEENRVRVLSAQDDPQNWSILSKCKHAGPQSAL